MSRLTVVGDALLDRDVVGTASRLAPDAPVPVIEEQAVRTRPGGAGLAAVLAAEDGHEVTLVTALGADRAGDELRALIQDADVRLIDLGCTVATREKIRLRAGGATVARLDRGGRPSPAAVGTWSAEADRALTGAEGVLVSCYGGGVASAPMVRAVLARATASAPVTWDPHPRGDVPVSGCALVTPNEREAAHFAPDVEAQGLALLAARADALVRAWGAAAVAVTRAGDGALVSSGSGLPLVVPATRVTGGDACGAGDRFAATAAASLAGGAVTSAAVSAAVHEASRFVASGGVAGMGAGPDRSVVDATDAVAFARAVRARGGTVVATGGCFDLVHAGHVQLLQSARSLGDCLIVCLNSDASVGRLKGADRPIVTASERRQLLEELGSVDAVVVFDEDTPGRVLTELRPHVFVKGGDYGGQTIPEAALLGRWGGRAVSLPYVRGRSTTRILEEVRSRETG